jgi:site-specific DNA-methyltransferase (adenine-specific)
VVLDFFAGSGTIGEVCLEMGRQFILVDNNPQAINVMRERFNKEDSIDWISLNA